MDSFPVRGIVAGIGKRGKANNIYSILCEFYYLCVFKIGGVLHLRMFLFRLYFKLDNERPFTAI